VPPVPVGLLAWTDQPVEVTAAQLLE
jgi:hypothetical protein